VAQFAPSKSKITEQIVIPSEPPLRSEGSGRADSCRRTKGAHPKFKLSHYRITERPGRNQGAPYLRLVDYAVAFGRGHLLPSQQLLPTFSDIMEHLPEQQLILLLSFDIFGQASLPWQH